MNGPRFRDVSNLIHKVQLVDYLKKQGFILFSLSVLLPSIEKPASILYSDCVASSGEICTISRVYNSLLQPHFDIEMESVTSSLVWKCCYPSLYSKTKRDEESVFWATWAASGSSTFALMQHDNVKYGNQPCFASQPIGEVSAATVLHLAAE